MLSSRGKKPSSRPWLRSGWAQAGGGGPHPYHVHGLQGTDVPGVGRLLHRFPHIQVIFSRDNPKEGSAHISGPFIAAFLCASGFVSTRMMKSKQGFWPRQSLVSSYSNQASGNTLALPTRSSPRARRTPSAASLSGCVASGRQLVRRGETSL